MAIKNRYIDWQYSGLKALWLLNYGEKDEPQPHVVVALGLRITN